MLKSANCRIGDVAILRDATARTGKVVKQSPRSGRVLASRATVNVTLGE
jgi:beta-lactam-binding protein with PASTA domain